MFDVIDFEAENKIIKICKTIDEAFIMAKLYLENIYQNESVVIENVYDVDLNLTSVRAEYFKDDLWISHDIIIMESGKNNSM